MKFGKCPKCKDNKFLTKHSKTGQHRPPFRFLCRECHDLEHWFNSPKEKTNKKVQRGTPFGKHKKK
ncbi:hypothetical protein LCGC14_1005660 [marine sediment metagenome]|uniref:Uncharacterized protein n=1 Tax=marine sediment metagenome TaxID=412755 RepID=A0A0F9N1V2_9ZZZZ